MSDVEDYAYSPYDDLEDILYDADPNPELADDLAEHALHSPVYQDEDAVKNELQDYFSDWNYYSDDYMDDDPILLRKNPQDGSPPNRLTSSKQSVKRGKKRKLAETKQAPALDVNEGQLLTLCIQGTLWAKPSELKVPIYKDGQEKKVALIKDWKKVFSVKDNGWGESSAAEDESWANDMSLADMGLGSMPKQSSFKQDDQETDIDAESDEEAEDDAEDMTDGMLEEMELTEDVIGTGASKHRGAIQPEEDDGGGVSPKFLPGPVDLVDDEGPRKRRRVKPELPSPPDSNETVAVRTEESAVILEPEVAGLPNRDAFTANNDRVVRIALSSDDANIVPNKKRKATDELEGGAIGSTASSRAKRVASSAISKSQSVLTAARTTRSTKTKLK